MKDFKIIELMELFDEGEVTTADQMDRPQKALDREMFQDASERFSKADGGMLVQPGFGGTRQGYREPVNQIKAREYLKKLPKNSDVVVLDIAKELEIDRGAIDKVLKEEKFKKKNFKILRKAGFITNENFAKEYKNYQKSDAFITGEDKEFAKYLNDKGLKAETKSGEHTAKSVNIRRKRLDIKSASITQPRLTDKDILKEAKKFKINTKGLNIEEIREKVIAKRSRENLLKKREADPELDDLLREKAIERANKRRKRLLSTEEGRALLREQQRKQKATRYQKEGLDPPANSAKEMLWKDTVKTAKEDSRFKIVSGYKKSMKKDDYYSNKIKIKDSITGKTFTFDTIENFINKNAKSFNIKNYEEVIKPYKQKQFINDEGLRNILNEALIPNYNPGNPANAFTIQHDFGRNNNPFKVSLAFYDENTKEYKIRSDFERAWEKSKRSKTPLADRKKAFNIFKEGISELDVQSAPSMVRRDRVFGEGLDLTKAIRAGKDAGATIPKGMLKKAAEFDQQLLNNIEKSFAAFSANPKCRMTFGKKDGGRINYATGPASLSECAISGRNRLEKVIKTGVKLGPQEGALATQILRAGRSLGSAFTLSGLFGPAAIAFTGLAEAGIVGYDMLTTGKTFKEAIGDNLLNYALGEKTKVDSNKELFKRFGTLPGMTDDKLLNIAKVFDQSNQLNSILKQQIKTADLEKLVEAERAQPKNQFVGPDDEMFQTDEAIRREQDLKNARQELENLLTDYRTPRPVDTGDLDKFAGLSKEDTILADMASGAFEQNQKDLADATKAAEIQKLESGLPVFMGQVFPKFEESRQEKLLNLRAVDNPASRFAIESYENPGSTSFTPMRPFGLAGGGIAGLSGGIDEGPQTVSMNPDSQGLSGLLKRAKKV